jgi:hypothetical protein
MSNVSKFNSSAPLSGADYRQESPKQQMVRPVNNIFHEQHDTDNTPANVPGKRRIEPTSGGLSLGGQTSDNPWLTTTQAAAVISDSNKTKHGLRKVKDDTATALWTDETQIDPSNTKLKLVSGLRSALQPSPQSTVSNEVLSKLKAEIMKRGALGIIGLQRKFKIMDVRVIKTLFFRGCKYVFCIG